MKLIIVADINANRIYINNLYNLEFSGKIVIKYFNNILYENDITLVKDQILWYSPFLKMNDISKIEVILLDPSGNIFESEIPLRYVSFMRTGNSELNDLCDFINKTGCSISNIIEIGSYQGESTLIFQKNFPNSKIFAVDFWINNYDQRETNINSYNMIDIENNFNELIKDYSNIIKIKMSSYDFSNIISNNSIDFIYIDGDHTYDGFSKDLSYWKNKIKKGGFIAGHDYNDEQSETIVKTILEFFPNDKVNVFGDNWLIKLD